MKKAKVANREKAIACLVKAKGKPVSHNAVMRAVYREAGPEIKGKLAMVLRGVVGHDIAKKGLPYKLVKEQTEKGMVFTLKGIKRRTL